MINLMTNILEHGLMLEVTAPVVKFLWPAVLIPIVLSVGGLIGASCMELMFRKAMR